MTKPVTMYQWSKKDLVEALEEGMADRKRMHEKWVELREQNHKLVDEVGRLKIEAVKLAGERYVLGCELGEAHKAIVKLVLGGKP